ENVDGRNGEDNRIINVETGTEKVLLDEDGAGGHSDLGHGYMVAGDNWGGPSEQRLWNLSANPLEGKRVYNATHSGTGGLPNHISFTNARPDVPIYDQYVCGSGVNSGAFPRASEIFCFLLDSPGNLLVVAPVMTDGTGYSDQPKGNLDVTGQYMIWTSNMGGTRRDAFIVRVPGHLLTGPKLTKV